MPKCSLACSKTGIITSDDFSWCSRVMGFACNDRRSYLAGFHEAIGDVMELSLNTPSHLRKIGLLPEPDDSSELDEDDG